MTTIEAKNLKVGDRYKSGNTVQEVTQIVHVSEKTIEYRTNRISPNPYEGQFFQQPHLKKKLVLVQSL